MCVCVCRGLSIHFSSQLRTDVTVFSQDERLAKFVVGSHMKHHPNTEDDSSDQPQPVSVSQLHSEYLYCSPAREDPSLASYKPTHFLTKQVPARIFKLELKMALISGSSSGASGIRF